MLRVCQTIILYVFRWKKKAEFQDGFEHGDSTSAQHKILHGSSVFQHDPTACGDAENIAN